MGMSSGGGEGGVSADINVTPMADIMLVLLIIFMITAPLIQQGVSINLARAMNAGEAEGVDAEDATSVTVARDETVYVNKRQVLDQYVADEIGKAYQRAPDRPLFVRCDIGAPYRKLVEVIDKARDAGVERIGLIVLRQELAGGL